MQHAAYIDLPFSPMQAKVKQTGIQLSVHHSPCNASLISTVLTNRCKVSAEGANGFCAGMHSSITSHLVNDYLLDEGSGKWGQNLPAFQARLGNEEAKARVENLYFAYLFVLRAVMKAGPYLASMDYQTGIPAEDANTLQLVQGLVNPCIPFDLFTGCAASHSVGFLS